MLVLLHAGLLKQIKEIRAIKMTELLGHSYCTFPERQSLLAQSSSDLSRTFTRAKTRRRTKWQQ